MANGINEIRLAPVNENREAVMGGCIFTPQSSEQVINGMTQACSDGDPVNKISA